MSKKFDEALVDQDCEVEQELGVAYEKLLKYVSQLDDVHGSDVADFVRIGAAMAVARALLRHADIVT